ncbi:MAG: hypothetical protein ABFC78_02955 [Methanoregula sp.]
MIRALAFCRKSSDTICTGLVTLKTRASNALNTAGEQSLLGFPENEPDICTVGEYQRAIPLKGIIVRMVFFVNGPGCIETPGAAPRASGIREMNVSGLCGL